MAEVDGILGERKSWQTKCAIISGVCAVATGIYVLE